MDEVVPAVADPPLEVAPGLCVVPRAPGPAEREDLDLHPRLPQEPDLLHDEGDLQRPVYRGPLAGDHEHRARPCRPGPGPWGVAFRAQRPRAPLLVRRPGRPTNV